MPGKKRAGFIDAPQIGPPKSASSAMTDPNGDFANEFRRVFFAVPDHPFRLSIKIEIRLANALDGSA
jgi:hypothetical protein